MRVTVEQGLGGAGAIDFQMPRWSPGRYAVFDFAKNVQEVRAETACPATASCPQDGSSALAVARLDTQTWRVFPRTRDAARGVTVSYKVFANDLSGTFSQLDARHANFNGGSVFMYVVGHKQDPVRLTINAPANWRVLNAATARPDQREWQFPNYDILIDTPTEIAPDFTVEEFKVGGRPSRDGSFVRRREGPRAALVSNREIVRAEIACVGTPIKTAIFSCTSPDARAGDGWRPPSTQIITDALATRAPAEGRGPAVHEFFTSGTSAPAPRELGPWESRARNTRSLCIAEG